MLPARFGPAKKPRTWFDADTLGPMDLRPALERLVGGNDLEPVEAESLMAFLVGGEATDAQIGGALMALASKGCAGAELAAFARVLRNSAISVSSSFPDLVDTCGTGGGAPSFNLSTAAAFVAAAGGAKVAKHGNRAVTSACGSADVLEALGARIEADPERVEHLLETVGVAFLFAPAFHPAMKNVGKVRRELGVRTVFNQLGPLANPAGARRQMIGVWDARYLRPIGEALLLLGAERAYVVHGEDGLDEVSPAARTQYVKVWGGRIEEGTFNPQDFGLEPISQDSLAPGASAQENAAILREAIANPDSPRSRAVLPSSAVALLLSGRVDGLDEAAGLAKEAIRSGEAARKLDQFVAASQGQ